MKINLTVNNEPVTVDVDGDMPLLWVLRDKLNLNGTKYSCGIGVCGACTVHLDDKPVFACQLPVSAAADKAVTTIEGLVKDATHPVIDAFIHEQVTQCGYCQPGMVMAVSSLLHKTPNPSNEDIDLALAQHLCRCGTYQRVRQAIHRAVKNMAAVKSVNKEH